MTAAAKPLTHSPIRGNCILEADPGVAQAVDDELRAAHRVISGARALHILARGLEADAEDRGDLPVGLAKRDKAKALKLARAAYDVVSRTQLVVHGLRDRWISFEEAIPPNG